MSPHDTPRVLRRQLISGRFSGSPRIPNHELETFGSAKTRQAPAQNSELGINRAG